MGFTRVRAYMKKKPKNLGVFLKTTSIILFFETQENMGGVSKNRMPTLMGVPFLKHPPNIGEKIYMMGKMPSN